MLQLCLNSRIPIYRQLKEQIKYLIVTGDLKPNDKLPPVRQLARYLRIDRNTVVRVYRELETERFLVLHQGKGTFVNPDFPQGERDQSARLLATVDRALAMAWEEGIEPEVFADAVANRWAWWKAKKRRDDALPYVAFVECDRESLAFYPLRLADGLGVEVRPVLLHDIGKGGEADATLEKARLVVTTFFHVRELTHLIPEKQVVGVVAHPQFELLSQLSQIPSREIVGVIAGSKENADQIVHWISSAGLDLTMKRGYLEDPASLAEVIRCTNKFVVSEMVRDKVMPVLGDDAVVLHFATIFDDKSIQMIRDFLVQ